LSEEKIILGIDPGTTVMGYGIIRSRNNNPEMIALGYLELSKITDHYEKLRRIYSRTIQLIEEYKPVEIAIEAPFYDKNVQSMLKLGRAQGVAIVAAINKSVPVFEYAPRKIKMSITGNGSASKIQVATLLQKILKIEKLPSKLDATDGLAAAVCHSFQKVNSENLSAYKTWEEFISKNPERIK
jgi:crossover junction endodeoxyribonuclease RuvC